MTDQRSLKKYEPETVQLSGEEKLRASENYRRLIQKYKKRQRDTLIDTVTTGLSYAEEVAVDLGVLEDTGLAAEVTGVVSSALPFAVIAITEQAKVIMGKKTQKEAAQNTVFRMAKTGAALGIGAVAGAFGGIAAAIPAALGMRALMDGYKSKSMLGSRIAGRTKRLSAIREKIQNRNLMRVEAEITDAETEAIPEETGREE